MPSFVGAHLVCVLLIAVIYVPIATARVLVYDDTGAKVVLEAPAQRIVSLAPHTTELLYAAGAGDRVVGVVEYSDYPEPAKTLPRIGNSAGLDLENILALRPDLIVAWQGGNPSWQIARLRQLGLPVYSSAPSRLEDVLAAIERLGKLSGTTVQARSARRALDRRYAALKARYSVKRPVSVFYQILGSRPMTINAHHLINKVLRLCGGQNIFAELPAPVSGVDLEAVLRANPEAILASGEKADWEAWQRHWRTWRQLKAVQNNNLYFIPPDLIHRAGPRIVQGAEQVCAALDGTRAKH